MRRRWVSSVILVVAVGGSFGAVAETAPSKPVDLRLGVTGSPSRAVVAGEIVTARASIQKRTVAGGAATSFRFVYTVSRGLKLLGITTSEGKYDRKTGRVALMQLRPGKPIVFTIRARVLAGAPRSVALSATVSPGAGWRETRLANNGGVRRWTVAPAADLGVRITDGYVTLLRGSPNTYTVTATNRGPTTVTRLRLRVATRLASPTYDFATGSYASATGTWSGLSLASGQSVTLMVSGTAPNATGTLTATAEIAPAASVGDPASGNNRSSDRTTLVTP
jgi:hypothetical protein